MEALREIMKHAEAIPRPKLSEVFASIQETLKEEEIVQPLVLPTIAGLHGEIISSSEEGDFAQVLLDLGNGLRRSVDTGRLELFFEGHPEFWHYIKHAEGILK